MRIPELKIDMNRPPLERWVDMRPLIGKARQILDSYLRDLEAVEIVKGDLSLYASALLRKKHREDIDAISSLLEVSPDRVLAANLYYDLLKFIYGGMGQMGCTTFAIDTEQGPIHARNLDWPSENRLLSDFTLVSEFQGSGLGVFHSVSWPGFAAVLSGIAPGRFSITLNAVLSREEASPAKPISFLIREVLEEAQNFEEAVDTLSETTIAADCLLLVCGHRHEEMCVIERTPRLAEIRTPNSGYIIVTNHYSEMQELAFDWGSELESTSCTRLERVEELIQKRRPADFQSCFEILTDTRVRADITMQHMVMSARTGGLEVRLPEDF
jgi:hypothetical protein